MDAKKFLDQTSAEEIVGKIEELATRRDDASLDDLRDLLLVRDDVDKQDMPQLVCRALLRKGPRGVQVMANVVHDAPGMIYPVAILESLWLAGRGQEPPPFLLGRLQPTPLLAFNFEPETRKAAREAFHDLVIESQSNEEMFDRLIEFLSRAKFYSNVPGQGERFRSEVFQIFSDTTIKLTRNLIAEFESLIDEEHSEEVYQRFLAANPVLIDPLASEIVPKQRLGIEFVTDFVVRRLDNRYLLVEIEKPHDKLFTAASDFSSAFTHAIGQIVDFQEWVDQHGEYARTLMPGISSPRGLLIMGLRSDLSGREIAKLKRYCINSTSVDILTYDELLASAKHFYDNIHRNILIES
jgi:Shedu protein SduA, C-terminal